MSNPNLCASCGQPQRAGAKFCKNCGKALALAPQSTPPQPMASDPAPIPPPANVNGQSGTTATSWFRNPLYWITLVVILGLCACLTSTLLGMLYRRGAFDSIALRGPLLNTEVVATLAPTQTPSSAPTLLPTLPATPTHTPAPTAAPTLEPSATPLPFAIQDAAFQDFKQDCKTDISITSVDGDSLGITVNTTISMLNGGWAVFCYGAKHTWIGTLTYAEYTFASDKDDPLRFEVTKSAGYLYIGGVGTVTLPDGTEVSLPQ